MTTIERFIAAARSYIGTPFHWHGRVPGVGLDCSGVIVCAGREIGIEFPCPKKYTRDDQGEGIRKMLSAHCELLADGAPLKSGDILVMAVHGGPGHIMIVDEGNVIHATDEPCFHAVVKQLLTTEIQNQVLSIYRLTVEK